MTSGLGHDLYVILLYISKQNLILLLIVLNCLHIWRSWIRMILQPLHLILQYTDAMKCKLTQNINLNTDVFCLSQGCGSTCVQPCILSTNVRNTDNMIRDVKFRRESGCFCPYNRAWGWITLHIAGHCELFSFNYRSIWLNGDVYIWTICEKEYKRLVVNIFV